MSFNGSGTFLINTAGQPVVSGTVISSTAFNALTADLATGLSTAITKDGQTTVTANIPMSTYKFTGLGVGSAATDSANLSQVQSTVTKLLTSVSGTDTITAVGAPVVAAYAAGQMFYFVATGDNTGAVTLNIDSLGAKAVTRDGSVALAAGDIKSGEVVVVVYDGTRFQVVSQLNSAGDARFANVSIASSLYVGGVSTFVGNAGFSANVSIASALSVGGVAAITGATTIGGNLTLNGGTANGVLYLNGSKVATSGAAFGFDGTNLTLPAEGYRPSATSFLRLSGGDGAGSGANLLVFGQSHATAPGRAVLTATGTGYLELNTNGGSARLDSSGNLGLGVTPSAWSIRALQVGSGFAAWSTAVTNARIFANTYYDGAYKYIGTGRATQYEQDGYHAWYTSASGTAGNTISFTQAMTLDASGNLGIGTSSPAVASGIGVVVNGGASAARFAMKNTATGNAAGDGFQLAVSDIDAYIEQRENGFMAFTTNNTERARITAAGDLLVGVTSGVVAQTGVTSTNNIASSSTSAFALTVSSSTSGSPFGLGIKYTILSPNNGGNSFIWCADGGGTQRAAIYSNGGLANYSANDVNLSDERTKKDIVPLGSMWNKFKAIEIVTFKYKDQTHDDNNIGVIAQQVESVAPEFVDVDGFGDTPEDGVPLKSIYTADMYHAAIKALQEAMARIEQLEAKFAALESK